MIAQAFQKSFGHAYEVWALRPFGQRKGPHLLDFVPKDGVKRLQSLPPSPRFRIEAKLRKVHLRRTGRPLNGGTIEEQNG